MDDDEAIEPWLEWMRRCTHEAEKQMTDLGIQDWVSEQRPRKWRWALKVAADDVSRWTARITLGPNTRLTTQRQTTHR